MTTICTICSETIPIVEQYLLLSNTYCRTIPIVEQYPLFNNWFLLSITIGIVINNYVLLSITLGYYGGDILWRRYFMEEILYGGVFYFMEEFGLLWSNCFYGGVWATME